MTRILRAMVPTASNMLALALLRMRLIRTLADGTRLGGRILEVESYPPGDPASHAFRGITPRCRAMFLPHWYAYVYRIYGTLFCLNVVSEAREIGAAVLIRALEPECGVEVMMEHRGTRILRDLTRGPGRLAQALAIDVALDQVDLETSSLLHLEAASPPARIWCGPRIGISQAADAALRFYDPDSAFVSGARSLNARGREVASQGQTYVW